MPIRPENRDRYPADWKEISKRIRFGRAGGACECTGQCGSEHAGGRCEAPHKARVLRAKGDKADWMDAATARQLWGSNPPSRWSGRPVRIILTTAHLNHTPEDCRPENLLALCQLCHLRYDADHHAETAAKTRRREANEGQHTLPGMDP